MVLESLQDGLVLLADIILEQILVLLLYLGIGCVGVGYIVQY